MEMKNNNYRKFILMLVLSFIIMYGVMFLNVDKIEHVYLSTTRLYMTLLMVAPMALVMLVMMPMMYNNRKLNTVISISSIAVFVLALIFLRKQVFVSEEAYVKAMIPHHSSAIQVSEEAAIKDPELKKLAQGIIESQKKEIADMKALLKKMEQ